MGNRRKGTASRGGFSLVELLVAITLLALCFLGIISVFPLGSLTIAESGLHTTATELAQQGIENLMDLPYDNELLNPGQNYADSTTVGENVFVTGWVVTENMPIRGCKRVVFTVKWDEDDELKRLSMAFVIASAGRG
jgi:prepilin-type N-terminal cleavage/methylation domain-containing protein